MESLLACSDDDELLGQFKAEDVEGLNTMKGVCDARGGMAHSEPGDGVCSLAVDGDRLCGEPVDMSRMAREEVCALPCTQELLDCIDNPELAGHREEIVPFVQLCLEPVFDDTAAGDGICSMLQMNNLCEQAQLGLRFDDGKHCPGFDATAGPVGPESAGPVPRQACEHWMENRGNNDCFESTASDHDTWVEFCTACLGPNPRTWPPRSHGQMDQTQMCDNGCVAEAMDCADHPDMRDQADDIRAMSAACDTGCMKLVSQMSEIIFPACCSDATVRALPWGG